MVRVGWASCHDASPLRDAWKLSPHHRTAQQLPELPAGIIPLGFEPAVLIKDVNVVPPPPKEHEDVL
jgi:hypothetical protein